MDRFDGYRVQASRKCEDGTTEHYHEVYGSDSEAARVAEKLRAEGWLDAVFIHRGFDFWTVP